MNNLERRINLLVALALADDEENRERIKKTLVSELESAHTSPVRVDVEGEVEAMLREIGVPARLRGYADIKAALCLVLQNPSYEKAIVKELYPAVVNMLGQHRTASRVERAIRTAIEVAWDRGDLRTLDSCFGNTISRNKGKPTNGEFISQLAVHLRRRIGITK